MFTELLFCTIGFVLGAGTLLTFGLLRRRHFLSRHAAGERSEAIAQLAEEIIKRESV